MGGARVRPPNGVQKVCEKMSSLLIVDYHKRLFLSILHVSTKSGDVPVVAIIKLYESRFINKLQDDMILLIFEI